MNTAETNLADADLFQREQGPPYEAFAHWRVNDPVHWNPVPETYSNPNPAFQLRKGFWVLTRYEDVFDASRQPLKFSSALGGPSIFDMEGAALVQQGASLIGMDPPQHPAVKRLVVPPFMPRNLDSFAPEIAAVARQIVDKVASKGECELVFDVASPLPVYTFCVLMGVPEADRQRIFEIGNALADLENPQDIRGLHRELAGYAHKLAHAKRETPDQSMMSAYANGEVEGERLTPEQILMFFQLVAVAGHETTRNTAVHFVRLMHEHPDQRALLLSDLDRYLPGAIDEVLRFSPPVVQFRRTAAEDMELRGKQIRRGDKIYLSYPAANRDPDIFPDPDRFDITRPKAGKRLSFGTGEHVCLGARLATLQLRVLLTQVFTRIPDIRPVDGERTYMNSLIFHALRSMPVTFTPEARA